MTNIITIVGTVLTVLIPSLVYVIRLTSKWTSVEINLNRVVTDVAKLAHDKEAMQTAMFDAMTKDREATDKRLKWLENHLYAILLKRGVTPDDL